MILIVCVYKIKLFTFLYRRIIISELEHLNLWSIFFTQKKHKKKKFGPVAFLRLPVVVEEDAVVVVLAVVVVVVVVVAVVVVVVVVESVGN